jgi:hypothetical protein
LDCDEVDMALNPGETSVKVLGSLIGWKVDKNRPDHLDKIRYASDYKTDIYDVTGHRIWSKNRTRPLVVGCNSEVLLIPEFSSDDQKRQLEVAYFWLNDNDEIDSEGNAQLTDSVIIPTPKTINKYKLKLQIPGISEQALIPEVYTVKRISKSTSTATGTCGLVYYMKCIEDSVDALRTYSSTTPDKRYCQILCLRNFHSLSSFSLCGFS